MVRAIWTGKRTVASASGGVEEQRVAMIITDEISEKNCRGDMKADASAKSRGDTAVAAADSDVMLVRGAGKERAVKSGSACAAAACSPTQTAKTRGDQIAAT